MDLSLFCDEYIAGTILAIRRELSNTPKYHTRGHCGYKRIFAGYTKDGVMRYHEYGVNTDNGKKAAARMRHRIHLENMLKEFESEQKRRHLVLPEEIEICCPKTLFTQDTWEHIRCKDQKSKTEARYHDAHGNHLQSRAEMIVAAALDDLGLTYKYEANLYFHDGEYILPDFAIHIYMLRVFFILEFMGMLDNVDYTYKNNRKILKLMSEGYHFFREFIIISGDSEYIPAVETIKEIIASMVNQLVRDSIRMGARP